MNERSSVVRSGIIAGGNWIVDHVKMLDGWPPQDALANILSESWANGGSPYNILKDLAKLGAGFPLSGVGLVGHDADGERIIADCRHHGIDVTRLIRSAVSPTSYSDVMTDRTTGRRTFFHQRGANAHLGPEHFNFSDTKAKIFHLGYLLLLDRLDLIEGGRPQSVEVLERARSAGLMTSADCVSENSDRFQAVVKPVLPAIDVLFANEFEAEKITEITVRASPKGPIRRAAIQEAALALLRLGVREWVILHFPDAAYAVAQSGEHYWQPSVNVPPQAVGGTAGAGDAFASGVLYGLHEEWTMRDALLLGVCTAASSLTDATCSDGVLTFEKCLALPNMYGWRSSLAE